MAATITEISKAGEKPSAPTFARRLTVQGDSSYATGGYDLGLATLYPGETIIAVVAQPENAGPNAFFAEFDYGTGNLLFLDGAGAEVVATTDVSGSTFQVLVLSE